MIQLIPSSNSNVVSQTQLRFIPGSLPTLRLWQYCRNKIPHRNEGFAEEEITVILKLNEFHDFKGSFK